MELYFEQHYASVYFVVPGLECLLFNLSCSVCLPQKYPPIFEYVGGSALQIQHGEYSQVCEKSDALQRFESTISCRDQNNL